MLGGIVEDTKIVVLAGGKSSRFGSNKAKAFWNGRTILEEIISRVHKVSDNIAVSIGRKDNYPEVKLEKIVDLEPGLGPLGGLYSCLKKVRENRVMLIACDMPFVDPNFIDFLLKIKSYAPIIVPFVNKKYEPLHAIYHKSLLPIISELLKQRRLKMSHLFELVPIRRVTEDQIPNSFDIQQIFLNINTQEQYNSLITETKNSRCS